MRHITINGFKSIRRMEKLELSNLNVIIGANEQARATSSKYSNCSPP